MMYFISDIYWT